jgi:hypothetical protein
MNHLKGVLFAFLAAALTQSCATSSTPVFETSADRTMRIPDALANPGSQVKVRLPDSDQPILVWRTPLGFGGSALRCNCELRTELRYNAARGWLECWTKGCHYKLDGSILEGPTTKPLRTYVVDLQGERLRILG